jgi:2,4-dienoyl-CoA reductase-like NADH-dependent reductase (Old Yellow Enzyme family)
MELDDALQVDVYEVIAWDHKQVIIDVEIVHAVAQRIGAAFIVIERLIAKILVVGDSQSLEEALSCFKIVAQVEGIAGTLAAQNESATALTRQNPEKIGDNGCIAQLYQGLGLVKR